MSRRMAVGGLAVIAAALLALLFGMWWSGAWWFGYDNTFCAGGFRSTELADGATKAATDAGFSFDQRRVDRRPYRISLTVRTGSTGEDAEELRGKWRRILDQYDGRQRTPGRRLLGARDRGLTGTVARGFGGHP